MPGRKRFEADEVCCGTRVVGRHCAGWAVRLLIDAAAMVLMMMLMLRKRRRRSGAVRMCERWGMPVTRVRVSVIWMMKNAAGWAGLWTGSERSDPRQWPGRS